MRRARTWSRERARPSRSPGCRSSCPRLTTSSSRPSQTLERHYRELQDIEFTIDNGALFLLQTRTGKRTAKAALRVACEMVSEGLITEDEAVTRIDPDQLDQLLHPDDRSRRQSSRSWRPA